MTACADCVKLAEQLKAVQAELRWTEENLYQKWRDRERAEDRAIELERQLADARDKRSVEDVLGQVVCARCKLACRDPGPGCVECWGRRQVFAEARR